MAGEKIFRSLKFKLIGFLMLIVVPLIIILYLNNYYSVKLADQQIHDSAKKLLDSYVTEMNTKMSSVCDFLLQLCADEADQLNTDNDNQRFMAREELHKEMKKALGLYELVDGMFTWQGKYGEFSQYTRGDTSYEQGETVSTYICDHIPMALARDVHTWRTMNIEGSHYFVYLINNQDTYIGAWLNMDEMIRQIEALDIGRISRINIMDTMKASRYMYNKEDQSRVRDTFVVESFLSAAGLYVSMHMVKVPVYQLLSDFQKIIILASILVVAAVICFTFIYKHYIFTPLNRIRSAIESVETGNLDFRLTSPGSSQEFDAIFKNFNEMASEIKNLKIDIYEEEIHRQKVELEYLHYQIKPHFFLNVINTINNLAQIREISMIQKMTQYLSGYIRYTFRSQGSSMVPIREELENVKNYVGMQLLRFPDCLECNMNVETRAMNIPIPVMTILTFVENIIKHAFDMYAYTKIDIDIGVKDHTLYIVVRDNGRGFSDEALAFIMDDYGEISKEGKHVGIVNIKKRLKLQYRDRACIQASNDHGAKIEIFIQLDGEGTE